MTDRKELEKDFTKNGVHVARAESFSRLTTIGTGGGADIIARPQNVIEFIKAAEISQKHGERTLFLGGGSNVLASDDGFRGVVVSTRGVSEIYVERENGGNVFVRAFAGVTLGALSSFCVREGIGGAEFLSGIPGTVGGAAVMNAGCFGNSVKDVLESVFVLNDGKMELFSAEECSLGYRSSAFQTNKCVVVSVLFKLKRTFAERIVKKIAIYTALRSDQPKGKSMGSVFRNGAFPAGKVIEACGLKGMRVGGAFVSEKHANFIINDGTASSADVRDLIRTVKTIVKERTGVTLEEEIKYVGEFK